MGMTDKQFNGFIRFLLDTAEDAVEEKDQEKREEKLRRLLEHLRDILEDGQASDLTGVSDQRPDRRFRSAS